MPDLLTAHPCLTLAAFATLLCLGLIIRPLLAKALTLVGMIAIILILVGTPFGYVAIGGLLVIGGGLLAGRLVGGGGMNQTITGNENCTITAIQNRELR